MHFLLEAIKTIATTMAPRKRVSRFFCEACDLRDNCNLAPARRRLCWEQRAKRPQW
jgi:hypothetical protein